MAMAFIKGKEFNEYELEHKRASYSTVVKTLVGNIVLCNNIPYVDPSIYDNAEFDYYDEETDTYTEIFQWFVCNIDEYDKEKAKECGLLFSYSNLLDCDVLCVDHFGTSWDYVLTDAPIFDTYEEWNEYMYGEGTK